MMWWVIVAILAVPVAKKAEEIASEMAFIELLRRWSKNPFNCW